MSQFAKIKITSSFCPASQCDSASRQRMQSP